MMAMIEMHNIFLYKKFVKVNITTKYLTKIAQVDNGIIKGT